MIRLRYSFLAVIGLVSTLLVSGCGTGFVNAVTNTPPTTVSTPVTSHSEGLSGVNMGGHAPLVGAHIYLVQLGAPTSTVTQTYGAVVKNLLTLNGTYTTNPIYSGTPLMPYTYPRTQNGSWPTGTSGGFASDQFVPSTDLVGLPFYGVTTNQYGEFNLSGDYACDPGYPVMLIGYGGAPSYNGAGPNTFTVTQMQVQTVSGTNIFTYTTSTPELFYVGETVTVSGFTGGISGYNQTGTVQASGLTSTQFSIVPTPVYTGGGQTSTLQTAPAGVTAVGTPVFNPAATNMAMAGLCPSAGNFNGVLNYIYMNEVSTTAAAYALAGFINTAATNQTGNDEFHIGAPVANLAGLQKAAVTAGMLYDIQGSSAGSTSFDGENHTARSTTPCPTSGTCAVGTVPNSQINTIANSLAACVDSNNTYRAGTGTQSTACLTLDQYAQDNGYYDTSSSTHYAFNIAQAAFNLARFPEGLGTATTSSGVQTLTAGTPTTASNFVSAIWNLPAGSNVPFAPALSSAPNDFAVSIQWAPGTSTTDVEIDANGNAWAESGYVGAASGNLLPTAMYEFTPATTVGGGMYLTTYTAPGTLSQALTAGPAIDSSGAVWTPGLAGMYKFTPVTPPTAGTTGTTIGGNSLSGGRIALDSAFNQYIPSGADGNTISSIIKQNSAGTSAGGNYPIAAGGSPNCAQSVGYATLDTTGNLWTVASQNYFAATQYLCQFSNAGALQYSFQVPNFISGQAGGGLGYAFPRGLATDKNDNLFFPDKDLDALYQVLKGTPSNNYSKQTTVHGQLWAPKGLALDGANTLWVGNTGDTGATVNGTVTPKYGTGLVQFSVAPNSSGNLYTITPNYITGAAGAASATYETSLGSVAIDQSGNVWSAQGSPTPNTVAASLVYEYIGLATPTTNPIAVAKATGTVAAKPGLTSNVVSAFRYPDVVGGTTLAVAFSSTQSFYVGEVVLLSGFQTSTYLNGHMIKITTLTDSTDIRGTFVDGYAPTTNINATITEAGAVSAVN